jgi:SAM-dependent methyltransferase
MGEADSRRYWDERARENALFYVDNEIEYHEPDLDTFWRRGEEVVELMLDMVGLEIRRDESVLDIGCGVGRLTRALARRAGHVYGLDVSPQMLQLAEEHNGQLDNVTWLQGDGRGLGPLDDASVDGCFSHVVFQHIPDPAITLNYVREMGRVLRPGGWALFQVSTDPRIHRPDAGLRERVRAMVTRRFRRGRDESWWGSAVDVGLLRTAAEDGSLEIEALLGENSQFTTVYARRSAPVGSATKS